VIGEDDPEAPALWACNMQSAHRRT
jgi:hypothetical protein